jgi:glycosyltransferase involved in cell wall biosynthesis
VSVRILYVADGGSPIALPWLEHFSAQGHEVHLVSTRPCSPAVQLASLHVLPIVPGGGRAGLSSVGRSRTTLELVTTARHWIGPLAVRRVTPQFNRILDRVRPDLVHAMRLPFEGMLAASARSSAPLLLSVWGNDFTLHAGATPSMRLATRRAMQRAQALHTDCQRDLRLAEAWGWGTGRPSMVLPGNGGVSLDLFHPAEPQHPERRNPFGGLPERPLVVQPRGFRAYVRNDTFFRSIPLIRETYSRILFVGVGMEGNPEVRRWTDRMDLGDSFRALPALDPTEMGGMFRAGWVSVSPSVHDGTPNTLLEAMACGCLPVAGDLESIREWITDGENGLLFDPADPASMARAVIRGLRQADLRAAAARMNVELIAARAERSQGFRQAEALYRQLVS